MGEINANRVLSKLIKNLIKNSIRQRRFGSGNEVKDHSCRLIVALYTYLDFLEQSVPNSKVSFKISLVLSFAGCI